MTFEPVLPVAVLIAIAAVVSAIRVMTLRRVLERAGRGCRMRVVARWSGLTLAVLLVVLAAARPGFPAGNARSLSVASAAGSNLDVFFVVDRSVNSRVEDFGDQKSRMAGIRGDMSALIDQYPRARFAVISFSSRALVDWPLSDDVWSLKPRVAGLSPYPSAQPDAVYQVNAAAASDMLRYKLYQASQQFPRSKNLVFYFGEGAAGSRVPQGEFDLGSAKVAGGGVLGYGTPAGGPIPEEVVNGNVFHAVDAQTGTVLNSPVNESALTAIADQLGVPYFHRESGQPITTVMPQVSANGNDNIAVISSGVADRTELYWLLTMPVAVLILVEMFLIIRLFLRNRLARRDVPL
jgi:Ca-activated chloride channel family protein